MSVLSNFLELIGLGDITGIDVLFAAMAIVGTFLFLIYFALILIGGVADGALGAVGVDIDLEMGAEGVFNMLTIQGLLSFLMMFGIFGLAVNMETEIPTLAILAGTIAGTISMWLIGKVFQMLRSLEVPELSYISSYAIHRGKQLEQDIWSVAGVVQVFDITKEALIRYQLMNS